MPLMNKKEEIRLWWGGRNEAAGEAEMRLQWRLP